jgi:hypothetical protein
MGIRYAVELEVWKGGKGGNLAPVEKHCFRGARS